MNNSIMATLFSLISIISPLFVFIGSIYYVCKKVGADSILLLIGSGIGFLINVFYTLVVPYLINRNNMPMSDVTQLYSIVGIISFFSGVSFAVGFFLLVYNTTKQKSIGNQFPFNKD